MRDRSVALLLVLSVFTTFSFGQIHVNDDAPGDPGPFDSQMSDPVEDGSAEHPFDSVQEAIDAAVDGDTIVVAPGHYLSPNTWQYDEINFKGKSIRLVSSAPTDFSVADQTVLCGVVIFDGTEAPNCLLQGFKIQNYSYGGILGNKTMATISHCIISGNGPCGATVVKDVYGQLRNCLITDNTTFHDCGVMPVVAGCTELINCTIANNDSGVNVLDISGRPSIYQCIIYGNGGPITIGAAMATGTISAQYSLIEDNQSYRGNSTNVDADPYFAQVGRWETRSTTTTTRRDVLIAESTNMVLVEGDYHLKTEGWRWTPMPSHGMSWYYDTVTSPAIDAGYPMEGLGEELERVPGDPEGRWGVNHAINLGAYGGTSQASLAPTRDEVPGVGAVDLQDYWPLAGHNVWSFADTVNSPGVFVSGEWSSSMGKIYTLTTRFLSSEATRFQCYYFGRVFYMTQDPASSSLLTQPSADVHAQYPRFLVSGSIIEAPVDPFVPGAVEYRSAMVVRGSLAEVLAGTSVDQAVLLAGSWPDVIAFCEIHEGGAAGDPMLILARGFGPLLISGQPVDGALVNSEVFGSYSGGTTTTTRR